MKDDLPPYIGFAGLWRLELSGIGIPALGRLLEARMTRNPNDAEAMMDMATLSILTLVPENRAIALAIQSRALALRRLYRIRASRQPASLRVLAIASLGDMTAITHVDCLVEASDVDLLMLYAGPGHPLPEELPDHDLVFVVAGESEANRALLEDIAGRRFAKPVLNAAERILGLSRDAVSSTLRALPGVAMPETLKVTRAELDRADPDRAAGVAFPVIVRPLDSQGGKDLAKVADRAALNAYLAATPAADFYLAPFIDYSSTDGRFRKFRVVIVDGRPYACHMAISDHWMVHYVNADMDANGLKRDEEAKFMEDFDHGFGSRHERALSAIDAAMGLDYYAIDCAETRGGELLVFELDTAMLVHAMDPADLYPYKGPQMRNVFSAFRRMLDERRSASPK